MPVGTQATVKTLTPDDLKEIGASDHSRQHLSPLPSTGIIDSSGRWADLHGFMAWERSILTDSGGFQVFSLGHLRDLDEDGVTFRSHLDGSTHRFTPESVVQIQDDLGSDIAMVLDECTPYPSTEADARASFERTHALGEPRESCPLAARIRRCSASCRAGCMPSYDARVPPVWSSSISQDMRIGGLSVGEPKALFYEMMAVSAAALPPEKPRYVMGVGAPEDLFEAVAQGIDMFDCVLQTRLGRNGALFTRTGRINIRNARFKTDPGPIDATCDCYTCRTFTLAYLHHLFRAEEMLAYRLASLHNLRWTIRLVEDMRAHIRAGTFTMFHREFLSGYATVDEVVREQQRARWVAARHKAGG